MMRNLLPLPRGGGEERYLLTGPLAEPGRFPQKLPSTKLVRKKYLHMGAVATEEAGEILV